MKLFSFIIIFLFSFIKPVFAYDGADVLAFIIGFTIMCLVVLACIGIYARKREPEFVSFSIKYN